jgi:hypothetical protein
MSIPMSSLLSTSTTDKSMNVGGCCSCGGFSRPELFLYRQISHTLTAIRIALPVIEQIKMIVLVELLVESFVLLLSM